MIRLTTYSGQRSQMYYLTFNSVGAGPVWGPFLWDYASETPTPSSISTIDFGPPRDTSHQGSIGSLLSDLPASYGEHSCSHSNCTGDIMVLGDALSFEKFSFQPALDADSLALGAYWFFNSQDTLHKRENFDSKPIGFFKDSSSKATASQLGLSSSLNYFPSDGRLVHYVTDRGVDVSCRLPVSLTGTWSVTQTVRYTEYRYLYKVSNFRPPNTVYMELYFNDILMTAGDTVLVIIPVSTSAKVSPTFSVDDLRNWVTYPFAFLEHLPIDFGSLAQSSVKAISYTNTNMLENLVGWSEISSFAPPSDALLNPRNPKNLAKLYLWYKYSFSPNVKDLPEVTRVIRQNMSGTWKGKYQVKYDTYFAHGSNRFGAVTTRGNIRVKLRPQYYTAMQSLFGDLRAAGLEPSIDNLWDLVPFSFVIDWFCPIGTFLSSISYDFRAALNGYDIKDVITSCKSSQEVNMSLVNTALVGTLTYTIYDRQVSQHLPSNSFDFGRKDPLRHIFEGIALIVANW